MGWLVESWQLPNDWHIFLLQGWLQRIDLTGWATLTIRTSTVEALPPKLTRFQLGWKQTSWCAICWVFWTGNMSPTLRRQLIDDGGHSIANGRLKTLWIASQLAQSNSAVCPHEDGPHRNLENFHCLPKQPSKNQSTTQLQCSYG